jgi:ADP-ribose pyrophosphatase
MRTQAQIASRRIYTGRVINLDMDRVRFPDGSSGELEIVRHPGASAVLPFVGNPAGTDPEVLLIRQYRYAAEGYLYEIPAGRLNAGESPETCARRELIEETGCSAEGVSFLTSMFTTPGFTDERIHLFDATGLSQGQTQREPDEFIEVVTMPLSRALKMVASGEIQDAKTAVSLLYAAAFRHGK